MLKWLKRRRLKIGAVRRGRSAVNVEVGGFEVSFESDDVALARAVEAFAGPMLLPAMKMRRRLEVLEQVDGEWLAGVGKLDAIYQRWWKYRSALPLKAEASIGEEETREAVGACFTGGVDSFYTQLRGKRRSDALVFVHGYDIPLQDRARADAFEVNLRRVAVLLGKKALLVRTNLRQHPLFQTVSWEHTHGAALAAAGHVLSGEIGTLIIPSSYTPDTPQPWGTHWETDHLWSTRRLRVVHDDHALHRRAKLRAIAHEPILRDHLRVCWENRNAYLNCSACEKCMRTMIILAGCEVLQHYRVFDQRTSLAEKIDAFPPVPLHLLYVYEALANDPLPGDVRAAVQRLVERTRGAVTSRR